MPDYQNSGVLFKNKRKDPKDPEQVNANDLYGYATVDGAKWKLSAWIKENEGGTFFSISFRPDVDTSSRYEGKRSTDPQAKRQPQRQQQRRKIGNRFFDETDEPPW